ncbi:MAG: VWA domain-containing protein, partial [Proteobacteria bacterium]|nr:VWA domain-containing protein [Pseudomonadota bacterium]
MYEGITELVFSYASEARAVILLTDGVDRIGTHTPEEVVDLAEEYRTAVYIVGLDAAASSAELRSIARETGGVFYAAASPDSLARIYPEILARLRKGPDESEVAYALPCVDGRLHTLELRVQDVCGGSDIKSVSFQSRFARVTFWDLFMAIGDATVNGGKDFSVPLHLIAWDRNERFSDFSFRIKYDSALMQLMDVVAPPGSLMEGVAVTVDHEAGGALVTVNGSRILNGSGLMLKCVFRATNPATDETSRIEVEDFVFADGCLWPVVQSGEVVIRPHAPEPMVLCDLDAPRTLRWDSGAGDYIPNPITVVSRAYNTGDAAALNARARISFDTAAFVLLSPLATEQPCNPPDIEPNSFSTALWQLHAKTRGAPDSSEINVEMYFDNHASTNCRIRVYVPAPDATLSCAVSAPEILLDTLAGVLDPMPFDVTVSGWNASTTPIDSVWATISLPPDLVFAYPDTQDSSSKLLSELLLAPGKSGTASWKLSHEPSVADRSYVVTVRLHGGPLTTECNVQVRIPRQPSAVFTYDLTAEGPTEFCQGSVVLDAGAGQASYRWNTGAVSRKITVEESGEYFCRIVDLAGNAGLSRKMKVTEYPYPKAVIRMRGPNPLCEGDKTWLRVDEPEGTSYLWSTGETVKEIPVWIPGMYHVYVQGPGGCEGRDTVMVAYHPKPLKPVITRIGDVLSV